MKYINGQYYRKVRFADGRKYLVKVSEAERDAQQIYWMVVTMMPFIWVIILAAAAGLI